VVRLSPKLLAALTGGALAVAAGAVPVIAEHCTTPHCTTPPGRQCTCAPKKQSAPAPEEQSAPVDEPQQQAAVVPQAGSYVAPPATGEVAGESRSMGVRGLGIRIPEIRLELPTVQLPSLVKFRRGPEMHIESGRAPFVNQSAAAFGQIHTGGVAPLMQSAPVQQSAPAPQSKPADPEPQSAPAPTCTPPHCTSEAKIRQLRREMDAARERILALQDSLEEAVADVEQERAIEPVEALEETPTEYRSSTRQRRLPRESDYDDRHHDYDYGPAAPAYEDEELEPEVQVGTRSRRPAPRSGRDYAERDSAGRDYTTRDFATRDYASREYREPVRQATSAVERASRNYQPEADEYAEQRYRERASAQTRVARSYRAPAVNDGGSDYESAPSEPVATRQPPVRYSETRTPTAPRTQASRVIEQEYEEEAAVASVPTPRSLPRPVVTAPKLPTRRSR
jgi:hypothetical protein